MTSASKVSDEEIKANMRSVIARDGDRGMREARRRVMEVHEDVTTRESLRTELARWLRCAREVLGDVEPSQRSAIRVYQDGDALALGGAYIRRRVCILASIARKL